MKSLIVLLVITFCHIGQAETIPKWNRRACFIDMIQMLKYGFTQDQLKSICRASLYFDIDILHKDGKSIIVATENSHFKNDQASELGKSLLNQFPFRGIENLTWENKGFLFRLFKWGGDKLTKGSTVKDSLNDSYYFHTHNGVESVYLRGEKITKFVEQSLGPSADANHWVSIAAEQLLKDSNAPITLHLERDPAVNQVLDQNCPDGLSSCDDFYLIEMRDRQMVNTINKAFQWFPKQKQLLVIAGHAHGKGLRENLYCESNYRLHKITRGASCMNAEYPGYFESLEAPSCE